jgi:VanZ family protein
MRGFLIIVWVTMILILTCTSSFTRLIEYGQIQFQWNHQPNFTHLLLPLPVEISKSFLLQKFGHIFVFMMLTLMLQTKYKSKRTVLIIALSFSVITELLQLFFHRDGRIFDIGFDTIGILVALAISTIFTPADQNKTPIKRVP